MKHSAHSKAVLDDSRITVDTTSLHQHNLYYCMIALICHIAKVNNTRCMIQSPDHDLAKWRSTPGNRQNYELRSAYGTQLIIWFCQLG